ncbi:diguanylate cyclase (GGDEF) domain-containing protein [Asanoa hainanensis]|uniref:Diguanylate cyclase (GGDEF) domain-containing protein n=1 Tax=Asanoa hainanensis TaxID=560556 RepID=A0A239N2T1_9ACTN|nr:sensor domain-containing diguanylate cyclase [Asanoa hainanensis]SNT49175.1 diguanylate cyclase (GGDEF) domain-containing protein [Asanoa hainanensis]
MAGSADSLYIQQLVELLAVVSSSPDETTAVQNAVERSAQALEAEVAAAVIDGKVVASIGFPPGTVPHDEIVAMTQRQQSDLYVPGLGDCPAVTASWAGSHPGHLVLARYGAPFQVEEQNLVRGMARVLELTLTMLRTLVAEHAIRESLQERQRLLEHLSAIQRAISHREDLQHILDTITAGARDLLGDQIGLLWVRDDPDSGRARLAAAAGTRPIDPADRPVVDLTATSSAGEAMVTDRVAVRHGQDLQSRMLKLLVPGVVHNSMAAPVHDSGVLTGALVVASCDPARRYSPADEQILSAFAENVSLALTDANTLVRMRQARHDPLTGLASRGLFLEQLATQLAVAERDGHTLAVLFLDLDRFKDINDSLGHAAGDELLTLTADRITAQLRAGDTASRFGGDEFAVMLSRVDGPQDAAAVARRIVAALAEPMRVSEHALRVGVSVGVALCGTDGPEPAELVARADLAMYEAKHRGTGGYAIYRDN